MHGGEGHGTGSGGGTAPAPTVERDFDIGQLTRVEGEGSLRLRLREGKVVDARLAIFEAPRYFEQLVVGRQPDDVLDIVARICGICPVAYQMSAVHAFEAAFGVTIDPVVRSLRRLLYCGEWIESHALHVTLLHAPDFLGVESGIALAAIDRGAVERGLALKKTGNHIVALLGGRPIHPVSVRVGGFSRAPRVSELAVLKPALDLRLAEGRRPVRVRDVDAVARHDAALVHGVVGGVLEGDQAGGLDVVGRSREGGHPVDHRQ